METTLDKLITCLQVKEDPDQAGCAYSTGMITNFMCQLD